MVEVNTYGHKNILEQLQNQSSRDHNQSTCTTKTVVVETVPFNQVSAEHAYHEGEGTRSLDEWRKDHWKFFKQEYADEHHPFNEELPCVCEVYK